MSFLIFDIETAPDLTDENFVNWKSAALVNKSLKDPEKIAADKAAKIGDKFSTGYTTAQVVTVGFLSPTGLDESWIPQTILNEQLFYKMLSLNLQDEPLLLHTAWHILSECYGRGDKIVGYNSKGFDIQMLMLRSIIHGIDKPDMLPSYDELTSKYRTNHHLDLFEVCNPNYGQFTSLNEWGYKINATNELSGDGHKVWGWFLANDWASITSHCLADLAVTYLLYKKARKWVI